MQQLPWTSLRDRLSSATIIPYRPADSPRHSGRPPFRSHVRKPSPVRSTNQAIVGSVGPGTARHAAAPGAAGLRSRRQGRWSILSEVGLLVFIVGSLQLQGSLILAFSQLPLPRPTGPFLSLLDRSNLLTAF